MRSTIFLPRLFTLVSSGSWPPVRFISLRDMPWLRWWTTASAARQRPELKVSSSELSAGQENDLEFGEGSPINDAGGSTAAGGIGPSSGKEEECLAPNGSMEQLTLEVSAAEIRRPRVRFWQPPERVVHMSLLISAMLLLAAFARTVWPEILPMLHRVAARSWRKVSNRWAQADFAKHYSARNWLPVTLLLVINLINLTVLLPLLAVFLRRRCSNVSRWLLATRARASEPIRCAEDSHLSLNEAGPTIAAVVPCYLPNEQSIIEETVNHIMEHVVSPDRLEIWVVYNTPEDLPEVEGRLRAMQRRADFPPGRSLQVIRVPGSKSKAENLNAVLPQISTPYVAIYDADHHPDPSSLMLLYEKVQHDDLDCAQGSTYIRNLACGWAGILGRLIDAEFFVMHFMLFPAMKLYTRQAIFGGSNALWKHDVLSSHTFNDHMQTEDIDVSVRALLDRCRIDFCPESRSGELAPVSLSALYKQRLRWAIGWDQVSLKYVRDVVSAPGLPCHDRLGLIHILYLRWLMLLSGVIVGFLVPFCDVLPMEAQKREILIVLQSGLLFDYLAIVVCCAVEALCQAHHRGRQSRVQVIFVLGYLLLSSPNAALQTILVMVSMWRIATGKVGGWVVTARPTNSQLSPASSPSRCRFLQRLLRLSGSARQVAAPKHAEVPPKLNPRLLAEEDGCLVVADQEQE